MSMSKHNTCFPIGNLRIEPPTPPRQLSLQRMMQLHERAIDSGKVCALVLLDLSSAFDTVDHDTLLHIMNQRFGVDGLALAWFGSCLADRTQVFHYDTQRSGPHTVNCSVPQGSILGPKEFIAFTEELTTHRR